MREKIEKYIKEECTKLIKRYNAKLHINFKYQKKFYLRTGIPFLKRKNLEPARWDLDKQFNPFKIRDNAKYYADKITTKIIDGNYELKPALIYRVPKPKGGYREVSVFSIIDSAISRYIFKNVRKRNQQLFSSFTYAYRSDRNAHHAVEHLYRVLKENKRVYLLEFDFRKYFDSIDHAYLMDTLKTKFKITNKEKFLIEKFLNYQKAFGENNYSNGVFEKNKLGVPQGTSISLFLANVACHELDREIEKTGAIFARYADDTVIICDNYDSASRCANLMLNHGSKSKTEINIDKSEGVSLLTENADKGELKNTKSEFNFLGHSISQTGISISDFSVKKIKAKISSIVNKTLIYYPRHAMFSVSRIDSTGLDWDFVNCINEIRDYIYGNISESKLNECLLSTNEKFGIMRSLLSYYPQVDNPAKFKELDGWLLNVLKRAQKERVRLVRPLTNYARVYSKDEIMTGSWYQYPDISNETKIPSFYRAWEYVRRCAKIFDLEDFPSPRQIS